ncbi:LacI family DNA-binding transcriptional regulator [Sphingomonas japonica]|uniref:LacI family transcriptional regulator n=1 Tax=Sphingomonas japonica TaxID=511662 RepID=A0ABX0TZV3_9SPHN|nr:LacI family DNA-binding transcriptional regulator [Sphingomonas japonica]NIJ23855.1 LacI family transcriptional regulator [Sphingomonas japonica]
MANVTIRDVAREAAVSVASASRALNGHKSVHSETRARILEVAERLAYVPHAGARSLSLSRAHIIGVVLPALHGEFFSEIVRGMDGEAVSRGYQLLLANMHMGSEETTKALRMMRGRVDGMVVMAPHGDPQELAGHLQSNVPAVMLNCSDPRERFPALLIENETGARAMTRHLIATGCRRIVHVSGPRGNIDADERTAGFLAAMAEAGLSDQASVIEGDFLEEGGVKAAHRLMAGDLPDAVFAANDMMAIGCMLALREGGISVPGELSLAGFDDIPAARYLNPALTTLRVNIADLGARAIQLVTRAIDGDDGSGPLSTRFSPDLMIRATTRPL